MILEVVEIPEKIIIGRHLTLPIDDHAVFPLWKQFRTEQSAHNLMGVDLYAIQTYADWPPESTITHWAGIEKIDNQEYPTGWMEYTIQGGIYATFEFGGARSEFSTMLRHVILDILPRTKHQFDPTRNQFQIMPSDYSMSDSNAIESLFVPVL